MQAQPNAVLQGSSNSTAQRGAWPAHYASSTSPVSHLSPQRAAQAPAQQVPTTAQARQVPTTTQAPSSVSQVEAAPLRWQQGMPMATSQQAQQLLHSSKAKGPSAEAVGSTPTETRESRSQAQGSADRARSADVLTSRVGEALTRLTVRVDEAIIELRAELPKARQQIERQQIEIERLGEDQERDRAEYMARIEQDREEYMARIEQNKVEYMARIEQLEKRVANDSSLRERLAGTVLETRDELSDRINADGASLEALAKRLNDEIACRVDLAKNFVDEVTVRDKMHKTQTQSLDLLEKSLADETGTRIQNETALGKELREHVALEVGGVREMAMREMKERMDGHKVLREESQLQQQALMELTSRIDEALIEVRNDVIGLNQQQALQKADLGKLGKAHASTSARTDTLEWTLSDESKNRIEGERSLSADFREILADEEKKSVLRSSEISAKIQDLSLRVEVLQEATTAEMQRTSDEAQEAQRKLAMELRCVQNASAEQASQLSRQLSDVEANSRGWSERKVRESEETMQGWVESTAVNRLTQLERTLKKEMAERAGAIKDVLDRTAHNTERWCQLQAKFDEILVEVL